MYNLRGGFVGIVPSSSLVMVLYRMLSCTVLNHMHCGCGRLRSLLVLYHLPEGLKISAHQALSSDKH